MTAASEPTKADTLRGGRSITVQFADGTREDVFVRQLPIRDFRTLACRPGRRTGGG